MERRRCTNTLKRWSVLSLSAEKTLDWWWNPVCAALFCTRPMEFGCVNLIWLSCRLSDTPLWLILPLFFPHSPSSTGFPHLLCIFSAPSKPLMLSSQLKCFALDNASSPPTRVGSIRRLCVFLQFAHTRRLGGEQREERCGSTRTVANAYTFHWGVTLGTASVAHVLANGLTNPLRDTTHTCHFSFRCRWREQTWEEVKRARAAPHHELRATLAICRMSYIIVCY